MRTLVDIPEAKVKSLDALASRRNLSRAELIRRGVDMVLESDRAQTSADVDAVFGSWKHLNIDSVEFVRRLRDEWEDDAPIADLKF